MAFCATLLCTSPFPLLRVRRPFWTGPETFGWLEAHYFLDRGSKPGSRVGSVIWLVEYEEATGERRETRYWTTDREWQIYLEEIRYSEGRFVRIPGRHQSDVIEKDRFYRISPGNNIRNSDETGMHFPLDYAHGIHLSGQSFSHIVGMEKYGDEITFIRDYGVEFRLYDLSNEEFVDRFEIRDLRLFADK